MLSLGAAKTFQDYADLVFMPYVRSQLESTDRVDIFLDAYVPNSLKNTTRVKRRKGVRRRVLPTTAIPRDWNSFLRVNENKTELFNLLSQQVTSGPVPDKAIYATNGKDVLNSLAEADVANMTQCSNEKANTRLLLHVADAVNKGFKKIRV